MRKQSDRDPLATFKGTTDGSSGYTVMRDHNGNFHYVNPRWQSVP
jgi:hypothetical protein